jgi:hypothetical protein
MADVPQTTSPEKRKGSNWVAGMFSSAGQDVLFLYALLLAFIFIFAAVYALTDIFGRRLGCTVAALGAAVTLLVTRAHAPDLSANLVRGVGAWPTAVTFAFLVWSAFGTAPAAYYSIRWYRRRNAKRRARQATP